MGEPVRADLDAIFLRHNVWEWHASSFSDTVALSLQRPHAFVDPPKELLASTGSSNDRA